ncbi:hypothetical protein ZIOFF_009391 [Zingiber officinale]|uniref:adenylate kinase n=1 Tax=Zingiber officinale TaxID=94328 RepID=A0A8J5HKY1_ZINOF|nr:hypothetical protein ZIOFF_009391 [Zingiber officinale]
MAALSRLLRHNAAGRWMSSVVAESGIACPPSVARMGVVPARDPACPSVQWVFLGCPGVGKGTYASRLSRLLGVPHIATGDLVRDELASSGPLSKQVKEKKNFAVLPLKVFLNTIAGQFLLITLGLLIICILAEIVNQGHLVSDEIIINLLSKRLEDGGNKGESGFILDGFPRTTRQAEILEGVAEIDLVVNLKLREDALFAKCLGRRICSQCRGNFNIASVDIKGEHGRPGITMAPLLPPEHCMSKLIARADDTEEVVKERLRVYYEMSEPVEEFYRKRGKLIDFDLPGGIPESWPMLLQALDIDDHDEKQTAVA